MIGWQARQHSLMAWAASAAENHIARGSLSSGPWNKCDCYGNTELIITGEV